MDYIELAWMRFESKVDWYPNEHGCFLWKGSVTGRGYGSFSLKGKNYLAHRISFAFQNGRFPYKGKVLSHLCESLYPIEDETFKRCISIRHLEETTYSENIKIAYKNGRNYSSDLHKLHASEANIGERSDTHKFTDLEVSQIRDLLHNTKQVEIAKLFGMSQSHLTGIKLGRSRK